jgi:prevent-host-death family protein
MPSSDAPIGVRYKIRLEVSAMQRIMPILPITDLRNQAKEALSQAQHEPVVITQNGRPSAVLINYALYNHSSSASRNLKKSSRQSALSGRACRRLR